MDVRRARVRRAVGGAVVPGLCAIGLFALASRAWIVPGVVVTVFVAVGAGVVAYHRNEVPPPQPAEDLSFYERPASHLEAISRVRRSVLQSTVEASAFDTSLQRILRWLADERLFATYGITTTTDPGAARAHLGEELWQRLTAPSTQPLTDAELRRLVDRVEGLAVRP